MKAFKSLTAVVLAAIMLLAAFAGCGQQGQVSSPAAGSQTDAPTQAPESEAPASSGTDEPSAEPETGISYPIAGDVELSYFYMLDTSYGFEPKDMTLFKELEKRTGVHMNITYAAGQTYGQELNILVSGGELPDLIRNAANQFTEGIDWAVDQEIIIPLNDYLEDYMPDFYRIISENKNYWNSIVTSNGTIGAANGLYYEAFGPQSGFVIRQDWLDELKLESP